MFKYFHNYKLANFQTKIKKKKYIEINIVCYRSNGALATIYICGLA